MRVASWHARPLERVTDGTVVTAKLSTYPRERPALLVEADRLLDLVVRHRTHAELDTMVTEDAENACLPNSQRARQMSARHTALVVGDDPGDSRLGESVLQTVQAVPLGFGSTPLPSALNQLAHAVQGGSCSGMSSQHLHKT